jgi:hypothetical protein
MHFLFLASMLASVNPPSPEQTAFNYFASEIVAKQYSQVSHLYLTGQSEAEATIKGPFRECFAGTDFQSFWYGQHSTVAAAVPITYRGFPAFKKAAASGNGRLQVRIYRAVASSDGFYTYISVYKIHHFVDHYLIKVSGVNSEVVEVCRKSEII